MKYKKDCDKKAVKKDWIENMSNAIQAGIITASTKQRLSELEDERDNLEQRITENRMQNPVLTRE